ncbi:MAG TPA: hypothetical protein PLV45_02770, partial [bacterium]|nr:hypothetical protein [bacterium]
GAATGCIFLLANASSLETLTFTRQYMLLALLTAGILYASVNIYRSAGFRWYLVLTVLGSAAFFTHFQSLVTLVLIVTGLIVSQLQIDCRDGMRIFLKARSCLWGIPAVFLAVGLPLLVYPRILQPILHQRAILTSPAHWFSVYRWSRIAEGLRLFVVSKPALEYLRAGIALPSYLWILALIAVPAAAAPVMMSTIPLNSVAAPVRRFFIFTGIGQMGMVMGLYLSGDFPNHAMGGRYMMLPTVFAAILISLLTDRLLKRNRRYRYIISAFLATVVINAILTTQAAITLERQVPNLGHLHSGRPVITTAVNWGVLPGLLWNLPPDTPVFATVGHALRNHPDIAVIRYPEVCLVARRNRDRFDDSDSSLLALFTSHGYRKEQRFGNVRGEGCAVLLQRPGSILLPEPDSQTPAPVSFGNLRCRSRLLFKKNNEVAFRHPGIP